MEGAVDRLIQNNSLWTARAPEIFARQSQTTQLTTTISCGAIPFGIDAIDAALPEGGLVPGALHELTMLPAANTKTTKNPPPANLLSSILVANCIKQLLTRNQSSSFSKKIFWLHHHVAPAPFCLQNIFSSIEQTFNLKEPLLAHCVFLKPRGTRELLQVMDILLGSPAVAVLVAEVPTIPFAQERRLAVRAKRQNTFSLLLREPASLQRTSAAHSRWTMTPCVTAGGTPTFSLTLAAKKGAQPAKRNWHICFNDHTDTFHFSSAEEIQAGTATVESVDPPRLAS